MMDGAHDFTYRQKAQNTSPPLQITMKSFFLLLFVRLTWDIFQLRRIFSLHIIL